MQNDFRSRAQASLISIQQFTNMLDVSTITLYHVFKAMPPFTDMVKKHFFVTVAAKL